MKTIMVIGAGKTQMLLIEAAKKEGYHTVVCDLNPDAPGVALADEYCKISTKDRNGLFRTAQEKKIDGILANSEYAMCDVAFISQELGLVGNPEEAIAILSSKSKFRTLQKQIGLFAPKVGNGLTFPVIIKPDMNSGTRGTAVANTEAEVDKAVMACSALSRNGKAIVEEYMTIDPETVIEGEIFIHKGKILWDGFFRSIRSKEAPMIPMTYVFPLVENRIEELKAELEKVFYTAGVIHGEYNIEACFVDDRPFIIEINPRQGGNDLPRYVQEHCGIDYYKLLVTTSVGDDCYWDSIRGVTRQNKRITHHMLYPRKNGRYKNVSIAEKIKECVFCTQIDVSTGDEIKKADEALDSIGCIDLTFIDSVLQNELSGKLENLIRIEIDED